MVKLRLGIILMIVSWLPFAQVIILVAQSNGQLTSASAASEFRLSVWAIQIVIGIIGVFLVGKIAVAVAKKDGWRKTPRNLWKLFKQGPQEE